MIYGFPPLRNDEVLSVPGSTDIRRILCAIVPDRAPSGAILLRDRIFGLPNRGFGFRIMQSCEKEKFLFGYKSDHAYEAGQDTADMFG
jgi:hypothetical protein